MMIKKIGIPLIAAASLVACGDSDNKTLATVGDKAITEQAFHQYLAFKRIPRQDEQRVARALEDYIKREALAQAVEASDQLDQALVEVELNELKKEILISRYFDEYLKEAVDEEAVKNYYKQHAEDYEKTKAHVAHILFRVNPKMTEVERQAKLTLAREAWSKLEKGAAFSEIARESSEDTVSAAKGGDLGWIAEGGISAEFSQRAFALAKNEYSEPFLTSYGFHIVSLLEAPQTVKQSYESVRNTVEYQLRHEAKQAEVKALVDSVSVKQ